GKSYFASCIIFQNHAGEINAGIGIRMVHEIICGVESGSITKIINERIEIVCSHLEVSGASFTEVSGRMDPCSNGTVDGNRFCGHIGASSRNCYSQAHMVHTCLLVSM